MGFKAWGLGFTVKGLGLKFRVKGSRLKVYCSGVRGWVQCHRGEVLNELQAEGLAPGDSDEVAWQ